MGLSHMTKSRLLKTPPSFIAQLINENKHKADDIYVTIAMLRNSKVLLERKYDENGKYIGYSDSNNKFYTGEGVLPGTDILAKKELSDITFFELSKEESPLKQIKGSIYSGFELLPNTTWTDYFNSAILIESSEANIPIESIL